MSDPTGRHWVDGRWLDSASLFTTTPYSGAPQTVFEGGGKEVDRAARAADQAFDTLSGKAPAEHAALLHAVADRIEEAGQAITLAAMAETGLPEARLMGEQGRTTGQLRLLAQAIERGAHLERRHDPALPDRAPLPRPELQLVQRPVGLVAVFGASNFPLAFSTAGGDTASALAAGCPVIFKGHPAHPVTGELVTRALAEAVEQVGYPAATFQMIQGSTHSLGRALVEHPLMSAVGFTGSLSAGRALFDRCAARPVPIPFYGELGSINPIFVLPAALHARAADMARGWAASLTLGAGQFCTNPGLVILPTGADGDAFVAAAHEALHKTDAQPMLTDGIAESYRKARQAVVAEAEALLLADADGRAAAPGLAMSNAASFIDNGGLWHEVFGPFGLIVRVKTSEETLMVARALDGQLTCTLQMDPDDHELARLLMPILERKAGRLLANGFPTGVEVAPAMVHGGPYPASTNFGHTSVGTLAIRRWLRPVCFQNMPDELIP